MNEQVEALLKTLPRKVRVGAYDWRIKVATGEESDDWGISEPSKFQITIWPDDMPTPHFLVGIVLHELFHAIYYHEELAGAVGNIEETIVTGFERGVISLYRNNPKLLTWIKRGLKSTTDGRS